MDYNNLCYGCMEDKGAYQTCPYCGLPAGAGPESTLHLAPGTIMQDKYLLGRALGQGGFGITYLAWDLNLNLKLAIKEYLPLDIASRVTGQARVSVYKKELDGSFQYGLEKYLEEARILARFAGHPSIVWVRDFFKANGTAYIVMEYVEGATLKEHLETKPEPLPYEQALKIFMPVLDALKEAHAEGILHRDISPDNLLISSRGRVVLIDFGAARQAVGEQSQSLSVIMKPGYSPEEQYHSKGKQGPWTDIYAVAASIYRAITGTAPPESLSRLSEDTLMTPSQQGIKADPLFEQALLKAMAVRAKDRYQAVEEFQRALLLTGTEEELSKNFKEKSVKDDGSSKPQPIRGKDIEKEILLSRLEAESGVKRSIRLDAYLICPGCGGTGLQSGSFCSECEGKGERQEQKTLTVIIPAGVTEDTRVCLRGQGEQGLNGGPDGDLFLVVKLQELHEENAEDSYRDTGKKEHVSAETQKPAAKKFNNLYKYLAVAAVMLVLLVGAMSLFAGSDMVDPAIIANLDADYYIDYENGTIPLSDLPIGARVADPTWMWEFRTGRNYTHVPDDETKPVTWIVVAKDHYEGLEPHVTLLSEELIGRYVFDNSTSQDSPTGSNHWGESGTINAIRGLRPWLNSTGIHNSEGFYGVFSTGFKSAVLNTTLPNKEWENGVAYNTNDHVFLPSTTELGDREHNRTYSIGSIYTYFLSSDKEERVARLRVRSHWYWTRSPDAYYRDHVRRVNSDGEFSFYRTLGLNDGVRPALNLKSDTLVSEIGE